MADDRQLKQLEDLQSVCRAINSSRASIISDVSNIKPKVKASINTGKIVQGRMKTCMADLNPATAKL